MRHYKTRPALWITGSIVTFIAIGLAVRFDNKGETLSMVRGMVDYFVGLLRGRDELFTEPFVYLALWVLSAAAIGWLLQSLTVIFLSRHENSRPPV